METDKKELSVAAKRRLKEKQQRYNIILSSALKHFCEKGYNKTTILDIAQSSEIAVGTVYFYFKNKEDIMIQLIHDIGRILRRALGEEFRKKSGSIEGFLNAGRIFFYEVCQKYPDHILILMRESVGQTPDIEKARQELFNKLIKDIMNALIKIKDHHKIQYKSKMSIEVIATIVVGLFEKISYHFFINNGTHIKQIGEDVLDFIYGGVKNLIIGKLNDN